MTDRVRQLRAAAIGRLAEVTCDVSLSDHECYLLASASTIEEPLRLMQRRLPVKREVARHVSNDDAFQTRLAVAEVAAQVGSSSTPGQRRELIEQMIARESSLRDAEAALEATADSVAEILQDAERESSAFGQFGRYAHRLYSEQIATIDQYVSNATQRQSAIAELEEVYRHYISVAAVFASDRSPQSGASRPL